jgi:hypothetical protein
VRIKFNTSYNDNFTNTVISPFYNSRHQIMDLMDVLINSLGYIDSRPPFVNINIFSIPILNFLHPSFELLSFIFSMLVMEAAQRMMII